MNRTGLFARPLWVAINEAELRICGGGAVESSAAAEGSAWGGRRSARLLHPGRPAAPSAIQGTCGWVDHEMLRGRSRVEGPFAVELRAAGAQEAVDCCLAAHRIADVLARPVLCTIPDVLARRIFRVRIETAAELTALLQRGKDELVGLDAAEVASAACAEVERQTGRALTLTLEPEADREVPGRVVLRGRPVEAVRAQGEPLRIGGLPGTMRMEELLLDAAAGLEGPIESRRTPGGPVVVTLHDPDAGEVRPLDLLYAAGSAALVGVDSLELVRERGTLLLDAATEEPHRAWSGLTPEQRAAVVRRRLELRLVPREPDRSIASLIQGCLPGASEASRALVHVDTVRLGEPEETESESSPRMPGAAAPLEPVRLRSEQRSFHLALREERGRDRMAPLRPAIVDALETSTLPPELSLAAAWSGVVLVERRKRRRQLLAEVESLEERLREMLDLPPAADGPGSALDLAARLGGVGAEFVDPAALHARLAERRRPTSAVGERVQRLTAALETLRSMRTRYRAAPIAYIVRPWSERSNEEDVECVTHADGARAAIGLFDALAAEAVCFARGLRTARLEIAGRFDEATHAPALERLDWKSLTPTELFGIPAIAVMESAGHLRGPALGACSELFRSGRPIHVLVEDDVAAGPDRESGYDPGLAYLAVAHREALVAQTSACRTEHRDAVLARAALSRDPAVIIDAAASFESVAPAEEQLEAAIRSRALPLLVYDPAGGATWAERFSLDGNPEQEDRWPVHTLRYHGDQDDPIEVREPFTFAHAAALHPAWRSHFRVVGPDAWLDEQIGIGDYLELDDRERARRIPYLWIVEQGELQRALLSWELAFACRDRARAWRILQELAGTQNAHVQRAAAEAREAALAEAEERAAKLEADFAIALESARGDGARAAIERLVGLLANAQGMQAAIVAAGEAPKAPTSAVREAAVPPPAQQGAPAAVAEGPYIDSFLCTTCNDCINLNPRLFVYDENKQARIGDPSKGTFKELVKAAEACPSRCIHPGEPRPGDKTATPALIERAAKFR